MDAEQRSTEAWPDIDHIADPFESVRDEYKPPGPIDQQKPKKKKAIYQQIHQLFIDHDGEAPQEDRATMKREWVQVITCALMREPQFWALCLDNSVGLYSIKPPKVLLKKDWVVGLYLRGFYHLYDSFDAGFDELMEDFEELITESAETQIRVILQGAEMKHKNILQKAYTPAKGLARLQPAVVSLSLLVRQEKEEAINNNRLTSALQGLGPLLTALPKSKEFLASYGNKSKTGSSSVLDDFGKACLAELWYQIEENEISTDLQQLPALTIQEERLLQLATSTDYVPTEDDIDSDEDISSYSGEKSSNVKKRAARKTHNIMADPPAQYEFLREHFENRYDPPRYPCIEGPSDTFDLERSQVTALSQMPGFKTAQAVHAQTQLAKTDQSQAEATPDRESALKKVWRRSTSFIKGRMISEKELEEPAPDSASLVKQCLDMVRLSVKEMHVKSFKASYMQFAANVTRSKEAVDTPGGSADWQSYTDMALQDNWYHVRKLLRGIRYYTVSAEHAYFDKAEKDMAAILAAIRGGTDQPIFFLICMDYVLRGIWRRCLRSRPDDSGTAVEEPGKKKMVDKDLGEFDDWNRVKNLFEELATMGQGAAIHASVLRFATNPLFKEVKSNLAEEVRLADTSRLLSWYELLYFFQPRCANPDCNQLLPDPSKLKTLDITRGTFSIGTRDARGGKRSVRQFISDRRDCYPCFQSAVHIYGATPMLVAILFYYSHVYHTLSYGCKTSIGKRSLPGLA